MLAGILGRIALSFAGTLIEKAINGFLRYIQRADEIRNAEDLGAARQEAAQGEATVKVIATNKAGHDAVDAMSEEELDQFLPSS